MSRRIRALATEPVVAFLVAGAVLFVLEGWRSGGEELSRIDVGEAEVERLRALWETQNGTLPSDAELRNLVDSWLREEIYYREAVRLGLDRDDTIVRRRLVQKLGFLKEAEDAVDPTDADLRSWFEKNREAYRFPDRYSFEHIYLSPERYDDVAREAARVLEQLGAGVSWRALGDPFMLNASYAERTQPEVRALFGGSFAASLPGLTEGDWTGPVESAYGAHVVRLVDRAQSHAPFFEGVQERVRQDYLDDHSRQAAEAYYQDLRGRYDVRLGEPLEKR